MPKITDFEPDALAELLASIGKAVARSDLGDAPCLAHGPSGMGPAKEMLKENFQPATAIPGYTGRRRV